MPLEMKNNVTSIYALNNLEKAQNELSDSLRRLSSGQKINIAADAPVGPVSYTHLTLPTIYSV